MSPRLRAKPIGSMVIVWSVLSFGGTGFAFEDDSVGSVSPGAAQAGDCDWDNGIVPNGFAARGISPPRFPNIRLADDIVFDGACSIAEFHANVIEDRRWIPGESVEFNVYADTGAGPGALLHAVTTDFSRMATGDDYFGREDYEYWIDGLEIALDPGTYWLGFRNPEGGGSGTNFWTTSDGGSDGIESDTGWTSVNSGNSWSPETGDWHRAFVVSTVPARGACCERDASCGDDIPVEECDARFIAGQLCIDLNPPCGTGACCSPGGTCVDAILSEDCPFRYADGVLCEDLDPPCLPHGACCVGGDCVGNSTEEECRDLDGLWFESEDCDEGSVCPETPPCSWDNEIVPDGFSGRALSPPGFPSIRVADEVTFGDACQIVEFYANVIEDDGWISGEGVEFIVYADTGDGPGEQLRSLTRGFVRIATGDEYFGRADYEYRIEGLNIALNPGTYWLGFRNPQGSGSGTNYWMTSDGGSDGIESDTGWFSLDGGHAWAPEGPDWHHAFVMNAGPTHGACCEQDASCRDDMHFEDCDARFVAGQLCVALDPPCGTGACCGPDGKCVDAVLPDDCSFRYEDGVLCENLDPLCVPLGACCGRDGTCTDDVREDECSDRFEAKVTCEELDQPCGPIGACCADDGRCADNVPEEACTGRFEIATFCRDLKPPCVPIGACCARDGICADDVREDECTDRFVALTLCEDLDPPCEPSGACCLDEPCVRDPLWICDGDVNGDGQVNPVDVGLVSAAFGQTDEQTMCQYDLDCDRQINPVDRALVQSLFGSCESPRSACATCQAVSESTCRDLGGQFAGGATNCPRPCSLGACCVDGECAGTMRRFRCEEIEGQFFDGEDCDGGFECS